MAKTKWTRRRRLNMDTALLVDTLNNAHTPTINRVDDRYDFLELPNTVGSFSLFFEVQFNENTDSDLIKIVGTSKDLDYTKMNNGWHISVRKSTRQLYLWNGRYGSAGNNYYVALYNAGIEEGKVYHLAVTKNGAIDYKVYLNAKEIAKGEYALTGDSFVTTNPITFGGNTFLEGKAPKGEITVSHFSIFNKIVTEGEINYMYTHGGVLPESAHASCVGYWTCQDKAGSKLIDSVEQFNYAKSGITNIALSGYDVPGKQAWGIPDSAFRVQIYNVGWMPADDPAKSLIKTYDSLLFPATVKINLTVHNCNGKVELLDHNNAILQTDSFTSGNLTLDLNYYVEPGQRIKVSTLNNLVGYGQIYEGETMQYDNIFINSEVISMHGKLIAQHAELINYTKDVLAIYPNEDVELLNESNFNSQANWILQSAWSFVNGKAVLNGGNGNGNGYLYQTINLVKSGLYKITFKINSLTQGYINLNSYSAAFNTYAGSPVNCTAPGVYTEYLFLPSGPFNLYIAGYDNCVAELDYASLKLEAETGQQLPAARQDFYAKQPVQNEMLYLDASKTAVVFDKSPDILRTYEDAYTYYGYLAFKDADVQGWGSCLFTTTSSVSAQGNGITIKYAYGNIWVFHTGDNVSGAGGNTNAFKFVKAFPANFFEKPRHVAIRKSAMVNGQCQIDLFIDGQLFESGIYTAPAFPASENISASAVPRIGYYIGDFGGSTLFKGYYGYVAFSKGFDSDVAIENAANFKLPSHADIVLSTFLKNYFSIRDTSAANRKTEIVSFRMETEKEEVIQSGYGQTPLPDFHKAVSAPPVTNPIQLPTTIPGIGNSNFSLYFTVHFNKTVTFNDGIFYQLNCSGAQFNFYKGRLLIFLSHIYYLEVVLPEYLTFNKGFYSICIQKVGERNMRAYINGQKAVVSNVGTGLVDSPYMVENDDIFLANITTNRFYSDADDTHLINYGIYNGNLTERALLDLYNNSLLNNPRNLNNWLCYYQFNEAGTSWVDATGNCANANCTVALPALDLNDLR